MKKPSKFIFSLVFPLVLVVSCLVFMGKGAVASSETTKTPLVAMEPIKSNVDYIGKALTNMFLTRLTSEGIDTVTVKGGQESEPVLELADFLFTGNVIDKGGHVEASFQLKSPKDGSLIKDWKLRAPSLDILARDASLLSAKVSDTIKHSGQVLVSDVASGFAALDGPGSKKIATDDEFQMARLHPDILVREKLEKDEEREIEAQKKGLSPSSSEASSEEDYYTPLPDVYNTTDDISAKEQAQYEKERQEAQGQAEEEEDYDSYMPIPDVYNPESDEDASERKPAPAAPSLADKGDKQHSSAKKGKSWYSWLWPFGKEKEDENKELVSQAKKTRLKKEQEDREPVVVSSKDKLPIPPPPKVDFNVPEPVPLDKALSEIEDFKVERKKVKRSWLSRLWPFGEEESGVIVKPSPKKENASASIQPPEIKEQTQPAVNGPELQGPSAPEEGLHTFESGAQIEAFRRHLEMESGPPQESPSQVTQPAAKVEKKQVPVTAGTSQEEPKIQEETSEPKPQNLQGPIWQWN